MSVGRLVSMAAVGRLVSMVAVGRDSDDVRMIELRTGIFTP